MSSDHMKRISEIGEVQALNEQALKLADEMALVAHRIGLFQEGHKALTPKAKEALRDSMKSLRKKVGPW